MSKKRHHHRPGARREAGAFPHKIIRSTEIGTDSYWPQSVGWLHDGPEDISAVQAIHAAGKRCLIFLAEHVASGHSFLLAMSPDIPSVLGIAIYCTPGDDILRREALPLPTTWANKQGWKLLARHEHGATGKPTADPRMN